MYMADKYRPRKGQKASVEQKAMEPGKKIFFFLNVLCSVDELEHASVENHCFLFFY